MSFFGPLSDGRTHPEDDNTWPWPVYVDGDPGAVRYNAKDLEHLVSLAVLHENAACQALANDLTAPLAEGILTEREKGYWQGVRDYSRAISARQVTP